MYDDKPLPFLGVQAAKEGRNFTAGRTVIVSDQNPAYVRPIGDVTQSTWVNAELRMDTNLEEDSSEPLLACNVDPFEFGQTHDRSVLMYYSLDDTAKLPTFYIGIFVHNGNVLYLPVARLLAVDKAAWAATFELDQAVEAFTPGTSN